VRGQVIGRVGMEGRATGPHLCWRMKWRDRYLDPSLLIGASAPDVA
jgi:murein DD-endopeptidase MepM/ murein hydrolase activator NlpD